MSSSDESSIRLLVKRWMEASSRGDIEGILELMSEDVVFMVPGREPFGKEEFAAILRAMNDAEVEGRAEIRELMLLGDWAWIRNYIEVTVRPQGGEPVHRSGYTLSILKKGSDGQWRLERDSNLVA